MFIVSEIGLNHLGDEKKALNMVKELIKHKIPAITFQIREDSYYNGEKPHKRKLSNKFYLSISILLKENNIKFGITIAGTNDNMQEDLISSFVNECEIDFWKTLSYSNSEYNFIQKIYDTSLPVYMSLGLSSNENIIKAKELYPNINFIYTNLSRDIKDCGLSNLTKIKEYNTNLAYGLHCDDVNICYIAMAYDIIGLFFYVKMDEDVVYPDNQGLLIDNITDYIENINLYSKAIKK